MKIAYFGYDFYAMCLDRILADGHSLAALFVPEVDNVYDRDTQVLGVARSLDVPVVRVPPTEAHLEELAKNGCDLIVVAAYPHRVPIEKAALRGVNVHPSLLPEGRGRWPLPWVILKGLTQSGVTIHKLAREWDAGDMLAQRCFSVSSEDNLESVSMKSRLAARAVLHEVLQDFERYWTNATPQQAGTRWPMPGLEDRTLSWSLSVEEIDKRVRAFGNFDSCAVLDGKEWIVQDAVCWVERHDHEPGTVIARTGREILVAASDGYVCLRSFRIDPDFEKGDRDAQLV